MEARSAKAKPVAQLPGLTGKVKIWAVLNQYAKCARAADLAARRPLHRIFTQAPSQSPCTCCMQGYSSEQSNEYKLRTANIMFDPRVVRGNTWSASTLAKIKQTQTTTTKFASTRSGSADATLPCCQGLPSSGNFQPAVFVVAGSHELQSRPGS